MDIKGKIREFIVEKFLMGADSDLLKDNDSFLEQGIIDSTGVLELVDFIQDAFSIKVEDQELVPDNLDSLSKLEVFIQGKLPA